ncbi:DMT family transporter [Termitidicoccus mucosus]|uniref:DMT family transporter n=1 Tax=Termitidicoccus mucosus TaxID=1184151 RepID=UPI0009FD0EC3
MQSTPIKNGASDKDNKTEGRHRYGLGILLIICAVFIFSIMDALVKYLGSQSLNSIYIIGIRFTLTFFWTLLILKPWKHPEVTRTKHLGLHLIRAACMIFAAFTVFVALKYLSMPAMTSIVFAAPLIVSILAGYFLGEKIGPRRIVAVIIGFLGVLVVTRPGTSFFSLAALLALLTAVLNAFYSMTTRRLSDHDRPETAFFYTALAGIIVLLPILPFFWETPDSWTIWLALFVLSVLSTLAHGILTIAHKYAPASILAPFYYAQLISAIFLSVIFFKQVPDKWTLIGGSIVVASGLYVFYREHVRKKEKRESQSAR